MRYIYAILLLLLSLPLSAAPHHSSQRDSSIHVVRGYMQRLQDELIVSFELSIDRDLASNESVVLEPVVYDTLGRIVTLPKIYINSRRQQIMYQRGFYNDTDLSKTVERKKGTEQRFHYLESVPYLGWMKSASFMVNEESCGCGLPLSSDIAFTTSITTPYSLPVTLPNLAVVMPEEVDLKIMSDQGRALILFPLNDTIVYPSFGDNQIELDKITNSIDIIKQDTNCTVSGVSIHGYASPEGPYDINERLSRGRSNSVTEYVNIIYNFPEEILHTEYTAEDWVGFEALLESSTHIHKSDMLKVIQSDITPDQKENRIRSRYPQLFKSLLDDWFIMLRHTDYIIEYEVCFFNSVEQIQQIYEITPKNLSLNELFQLSQSYEDGSEQQGDIFIKSVILYPDDPIANLNAACAALRRRDIASAQQYLDLAPDCGERDLAIAVYYLLLEEYDETYYFLNRANQRGIQESQQYLQIYQSINH